MVKHSDLPQTRWFKFRSMAVVMRTVLLLCIVSSQSAVGYAQIAIPTAGVIATVAGNGTAGYTGDTGVATSAELNIPYGVAVDNLGNFYIGDWSNHCIRKVTVSSGIITTIAGACGTAGSTGDGGAATNAKLNNPAGVAVDGAGNIYIADYSNSRIRKVIAATGIITTVAGTGTAGFSGDGGAATSAQINGPRYVAVDASGNIYIADKDNSRVRKVTISTGVIVTIAGNGLATYQGDGVAATSTALGWPYAVAVDGAGNVYIADTNNNRIRKVLAATGIITTIAGNGSQSYGGDGGAATSASFNVPQGIAVDIYGNLYISDTGNNRVRKVIAATGIIQTIAGNGTAGYTGDGGAGTSAELKTPLGVTIDRTGNVYVSDTNNDRVRVIGAPVTPVITWPTPTAIPYGTALGSTQLNATTSVAGTFVYSPSAGVILLPGSNTLSVTFTPTDFVHNNLATATVTQVVNSLMPIPITVPNSGSIGTLAGIGTQGFYGDTGYGQYAQLNSPYGVALDSAGNLYIGDWGNHCVRKMTASSSIITTIAGTCGVVGSTGDGGAATSAKLNNPAGVAVDGSGNIYIADYSNSRIRKITASTGVIATIAGTGTAGFSGDGGAATSAQINGPRYVALDASGNIYIADKDNSRVRKVTISTGVIATIAGNGLAAYQGDGVAATSTALGWPYAVAVDGTGNVYIADTNNNRIRKVLAATGIITTVAGNGSQSYGGDGGAATSASFNVPQGIAVDIYGNLYISDTGNNRVRKVIAATGIIQTIAGNGTAGYTGDGGAGTSAELKTPLGITLDSARNIYVADTGNNRIRIIGGPPKPSITWTNPAPITYGTPLNTTQLNATASVAGTFVYSPATGTVLQAGVNTLSVTFTPTDIVNYVSVTYSVSLVVNSASSIITWSTPAQITYGTPLSSTQLNATASVPGTFAYSPAAGTVLSAGASTLSVTFTPTDTTNYSTSFSTTLLVVNKATSTITWPVPNAIGYGTALSTDQLNAVASVPGSFVYTPAAGALLPIGTNTISVIFTPIDTTDYTTATSAVSLIVNKGNPSITWPTPAAINYGTALSATQLNATASVPGIFVYNPATGTIPSIGTTTLSVTFTPTDTTHYNQATAAATLTINKTPLLITWPTPAPIVYGTALSTTQLNATASIPGSFVYSPVAGTILTGGTNTLSATFSPDDTTNYNLTTATTTLTVKGATPAITWPTPAAISYGTALSATQLNATAPIPGTFVYSPAAGAVPLGGTNTLSVTFTPTDRTNYTTATTKAQLIVNPITPIIAWATPAAIDYGTALDATQLNATASAPGTFTYTPLAGTVLVPGSSIITVTFTPADGASYTTATAAVTQVVGNPVPTPITIPAPKIIDTLGGNGVQGNYGDTGFGQYAQLNQPLGVAVDHDGNIYISDTDNNVIRKIDASSSIITTIAGVGSAGYSGTSGPATSMALNGPEGIAFDNSGNLYITDTNNNMIRKLTMSTGMMTTVAGSGFFGYLGDGGVATGAGMENPRAIAVDNAGNIYIAETIGQRIRKVTASTGIITTIAGTGVHDYSGDGSVATNAFLNFPCAVAVDASGNVYLTDTNNNRIRKIDAATGIITTVAGNGGQGYTGDGQAAANATFYHPQGLVFDPAGNLYIADTLNRSIRKIDVLTGIISTIAGDGVYGYKGDGQPGTNAELRDPHGITSDREGNIYITDSLNSRVRVLGGPPVLNSLSPTQGPVGTAVTLNGFDFRRKQGSGIVTWDSIQKDTASWNDTAIVSAVPSGFQVGPHSIAVQIGGVLSQSQTFTVYPAIAGISSTSGAIGDKLTITGTSFGDDQDLGTVTIGGVEAEVVSWEDTEIVVFIPIGLTSGDKDTVVQVSGFTSNTEQINIYPAIRTLSPVSGIVGTMVTITGSSLGANQGASTVTVAGIRASISLWQDDSIRFAIPDNLPGGNQDVIVQVGGITSNAGKFALSPRIENLTPVNGTVGGILTIFGTGFGSSQGDSTITIGGIQASIISWNHGAIVAIAPNGLPSGLLDVVVQVGGFSSNSLKFKVSPSITNTSPGGGAIGFPVTIFGASFGASQGSGTVTMGGVQVAVTSWQDTIIVVSVPNGLSATSQDIVVQVAGLSSNAAKFIVSPSITNISPSSGIVGSTVTISGNFGISQGIRIVTIGGTEAAVTSWQDNAIVATVPDDVHAGGQNVVIQGGGLSSNALPFTVVPAITGVSPTKSAVGAFVTVSGTSFGDSQGSSSLTFNETSASIVQWSDTSVVATVPQPAAGSMGMAAQNKITTRAALPSNAIKSINSSAVNTVNIAVIVNGISSAQGESSGIAFTIVSPPALTGVSPSRGKSGDTITITGTDFGATQDTGWVNIGGIPAVIQSWIDTSIVVMVPGSLAAQDQPVVVHANGVDSNNGTFTLFSASKPTSIYTVAGNGTYGYWGDGGPAINASFAMNCSGVCATWNENWGVISYVMSWGVPAISADAKGNIYVADSSNHRIRRIDANNGDITTVAGNGNLGPAGDGSSAINAELAFPTSVVVDASSNLYIADGVANIGSGLSIRKVDASTGTITTLITLPDNNFHDRGVPGLPEIPMIPMGNLALDAAGNLYFTEGQCRGIAELTPSGNIINIAGLSTANYNNQIFGCTATREANGDGGPATSASFGGFNGIAVDGQGNVYVADVAENDYPESGGVTVRSVIRKISASTGIIMTIAGNLNSPTLGYSGDGVPALGSDIYPSGITADAAGNIYFSEYLGWNTITMSRIRKIDAVTGIITTVAGNSTVGYSGDGGLATNSSLQRPMGLTMDGSGTLYVADSMNERIRAITNKNLPVITWPTPAAITYGTSLSDTQLNATASVPGTFIYTPAIGTVLDAGPQKLYLFFRPADTVNNASIGMSVPFTINVATPTISLASSANPSRYSDAVTFSATLSSALTGEVKFFDGGVEIGRGLINGTTAILTIRKLSVGGHSITASWNSSSPNYNSAVSNTLTQVVSPKLPTVVWPPLSSLMNGTALSAAQLNATANVSGTFAYSPSAGTILPPGPQILSVIFMPADSSNYSTVTITNTLQVISEILAPKISAISPDPAVAGSVVTISGENFGTNPEAGAITFNGVPATAVNWGSNSIDVMIPAGATTGNVVITVNGTASNKFLFMVSASCGPQ